MRSHPPLLPSETAALVLWTGLALLMMPATLARTDNTPPLPVSPPAAQDVGSVGRDESPGIGTPPPAKRPRKETGRSAVRVRLLRPLAASTHPLRQFMAVMLHQQTMVIPSGRNLPRHLRDREHWDYPLAFQWVPRSWTSFGWGRPKMILGNQVHFMRDSPKPIGEKASFQVSRYPDLPIPLCWLPLYVAFTTRDGVHFRLGARWDDVDSYTQFPSIAVKKLRDKK